MSNSRIPISDTSSYYLISQSKPMLKENLSDHLDSLRDCLQNGNSEILIDLLHELVEELNLDLQKQSSSYSAINNNHLHVTPMFNSNLQFSNNKEKKNKLENFYTDRQ